MTVLTFKTRSALYARDIRSISPHQAHNSCPANRRQHVGGIHSSTVIVMRSSTQHSDDDHFSARAAHSVRVSRTARRSCTSAGSGILCILASTHATHASRVRPAARIPCVRRRSGPAGRSPARPPAHARPLYASSPPIVGPSRDARLSCGSCSISLLTSILQGSVYLCYMHSNSSGKSSLFASHIPLSLNSNLDITSAAHDIPSLVALQLNLPPDIARGIADNDPMISVGGPCSNRGRVIRRSR
ncbi:hypothetical protein C8J57DRAFT_1728659 [Mycena rebaudengoi]|nr:hypothetical protein C8J57DRAFT_1728659 [Mycena rebaudengoi]